MISACSTLPSVSSAFLEAHLDYLCEAPYDLLRALPESRRQLLDPDQDRIQALLWKDELDNGELLLVLQSLAGGACGGGSIQAVGRIVCPDGKIRPASEHQLAEFRMS
ncbi:MAG: hypothetical protein ACKO6N_21850 [Myxococcota bacterium]